MIDKVLPVLLDKTTSIDLNCRHGSVIAIGEVVYALSKLTGRNDLLLAEPLLRRIKGLIPKFKDSLYFRGLGGELMKQACADFIEKCSLAKLPFQNDSVVGEYSQTINNICMHLILN